MDHLFLTLNHFPGNETGETTNGKCDTTAPGLAQVMSKNKVLQTISDKKDWKKKPKKIRKIKQDHKTLTSAFA